MAWQWHPLFPLLVALLMCASWNIASLNVTVQVHDCHLFWTIVAVLYIVQLLLQKILQALNDSEEEEKSKLEAKLVEAQKSAESANAELELTREMLAKEQETVRALSTKINKTNWNVRDMRAVIQLSTMNEEMQQKAIECAKQAFEKYTDDYDEIAKFIVESFETLFDSGWSCVIGSGGGGHNILHEHGCFIDFCLLDVEERITLFKNVVRLTAETDDAKSSKIL